METAVVDNIRTMILSGQIPPEGIRHPTGELDLSNQTELTALPRGLHDVWGIDLHGCTAVTSLPDDLQMHRLNLNDCPALEALPHRLSVFHLQAQRSGLRSIPDDLQVSYKLDLTDCIALEHLPEDLHVGSLIVRDCRNLEALPEGLQVYFLDAANCMNLNSWGCTGQIEVGNINLSGCRNLGYLPDWMTKVAQLNLRDCANLRELPSGLQITSRLEISGSGLTSLPQGCRTADLRWNDVAVDERIAFHPETISARDILAEQNIERRRVMLERIGYEAFFKQANARELDRDFDPGGLRRLLRVEFEDRNPNRRDEPLVCLSVICPSTARGYIIRVPPTTRSCRQAAAWIAGFDTPEQYAPLRET